MKNTWMLGFDNAHIFVALVLYKEVLEDTEDPERFLKQKRNILYQKIETEEAEAVFLSKGIKLPGIIN